MSLPAAPAAFAIPTVPAKTQAARALLAGPRATLAVPLRMLLINVDGRRGVPELLDIARSLNLGPDALQALWRDGLIEWPAQPQPEVVAQAPAPAHAPVPVPAPAAISAPATAQASAPAPTTAGDDLRRLMRAKMFAFDLACRMLAGRDAELRATAREVNSESRFLDWIAQASARIEAASDAERAQLFRERVAQAAV